MATGSGKTKVMSLLIAWQYFNATAEPDADYAKTFLVIAPNVIVFERLRSDFEGGYVYRTDQVIPPELKTFWDMNFYVRGDAERSSSEGALYLTNIQQMYERDEPKTDEPDAMSAMMGPKPPAKVQTVEDFAPRIAKRGGPIAVLNDEAHHTHDEDSAWNLCIRDLHAKAPLAVQLDFTATPRHTKGELFSWTVFDYPLKQAILDGIVKRPLKGITKGIAEKPSDIASTRYQAYLAAGVERWKEYRDQLKPLGKKPLLFVMMHNTEEADEVGDWLQKKYPEAFGADKLLVIHTDRHGDVAKKEVETLRVTARDVDKGTSPVNGIVSVMMLREGWDVQGVTVIVGLRPYAAKANILPEQTVGRGLRLMFRGDGLGYTERVDIIGNKRFIEFVEQLEREEDFQLEEFDPGKDKVVIVTICVDEAKRDMDIAVPELTPILVRKKSLEQEIAELDIPAPAKGLPLKEDSKEAQEFRYEGHDLIDMKMLFERDYKIPAPQTAEEVIGYYARRIAQDVKPHCPIPRSASLRHDRPNRLAPVSVRGAGPQGPGVPFGACLRAKGGTQHAGNGEGHFEQRRRIRDHCIVREGAAKVGGRRPKAGVDLRRPVAFDGGRLPVVTADGTGEEVHFQLGAVPEQARGIVRQVFGEGRRRGSIQQVAGTLRIRDRIHRFDGEPSALRIGLRRRGRGRGSLRRRDERPRRRERRAQGSRRDALGRKCHRADGNPVGLPQSAPDRVRKAPTDPVRRLARCASFVMPEGVRSRV